MGRGAGTSAAAGLVGSSASTPRKEQLMRAMLAAGAYTGSGSHSGVGAGSFDGFFALWALTKDCRRPFLPEALKLPDSRYSGALAALEADGYIESKFIREQHLLWRLTAQGVAAAQALSA